MREGTLAELEMLSLRKRLPSLPAGSTTPALAGPTETAEPVEGRTEKPPSERRVSGEEGVKVGTVVVVVVVVAPSAPAHREPRVGAHGWERTLDLAAS